MFAWTQIQHRGRGLTFDDVLLVPTKSEVRSRRDPSLQTQLTRRHQIQIPMVSANMDTVTESNMALAMGELGGAGILHRFVNIPDQVSMLKTVTAGLSQKASKVVAASIGVNDDFQERASALVDAGANVLTIDIAHGHSIAMLEALSWVKKRFTHVDVIAGNVATPEATLELIEAGADAIKVGIGPGSMCTTRIITGAGIPQLTAIALCAEVARAHQVPVIADGGIRTSGDIVKCIAAGASSVMLGSMLSGTIETPGEIQHGKKQYRGMASKSAQISWRGGVPEGMAPEGESTFVSVKGHVRDVIFELCGGLRSGMSYLGATNLLEVLQNAKFIEMSPAGRWESHAHGLGNSNPR